MISNDQKTLTPRQAEILTYIAQEIDAECSPTYAEIAEQFEIQPNAARDHVAALVKKGALMVRQGKARSFRIVR